MSENFTRNDLAAELSRRMDMPVDRAKGVVDQTLDALCEALAAKKNLEFRGFGMFDVVQRKAKIGRNPRNPAAGQYQIPERCMVRFRVGKHLFQKLNPDQP